MAVWNDFVDGRLYKKFIPGGREKDGLVLRHWVKKGSIEEENGLLAGIRQN